MADFLRLKLFVFLFLAILPQYSFGMQKVSGPRPPSHCPSEYFESPLPERAKFDILKRIIVDYGERNVSSHLRALLDNNVTIRRGPFKFHNSTGYTSLDEIDDCTLMYDFLKTKISLAALEKRLNHSVALKAQRIKKHRAEEGKVKAETKPSNIYNSGNYTKGSSSQSSSKSSPSDITSQYDNLSLDETINLAEENLKRLENELYLIGLELCPNYPQYSFERTQCNTSHGLPSGY